MQAESDCLHPNLGDSLTSHEAQSSASNSQALEGCILEVGGGGREMLEDGMVCRSAS